MAAPVVGIVGAKALRKDLNRLVDDVKSPLYQAMTAAGKAAVEPVVALTREALPHSGRPDSAHHRAGALAASVRSSGTRTGGNVRMGRANVPYAGWVEFGGARPDTSSRPFVPTGRYLFPAARGDAERAARAYADNLTSLFARPDIWTNSTTNPGAVHD